MATTSDHVDGLIEARLTTKDMMRIFQLSRSAFYIHDAAGQFDTFEVKPRIGRRFFSAKKVMAHFDREGQVGKRQSFQVKQSA